MTLHRDVRDALAVYRLTRLATADVITQPIRDEVVCFAYVARDGDRATTERKRTDGRSWTEIAMDDPDAPKLATLVTCRWCAGVWISLAAVLARRRAPRAWAALADVSALSAAAALLAGLED